MPIQISRRHFIKQSGALFALGSGTDLWGDTRIPDQQPRVRFGIVTDPHYADREPRGTRYYRQSLDKMRECIDHMNTQDLDFLIELGDFKDEGLEPTEGETLRFLREIEGVFSGFQGPRYHVLGNHDLDSISKAQFQEVVDNTSISKDQTWYAFGAAGYHCIVLDANFRKDGVPYDRGNFSWQDANIPPVQLEWLERELGSTRNPNLIFCHQLLTGKEPHSVINAAEVREILERKKSPVVACFHGHKHDGDHQFINGIHYYTHKGMVEGSGLENSAYSVVEVYVDKTMVITGYRQAETTTFPPPDLESKA